ncbi:MAG: hypothetical protein C5B50_17960 [Verrucomicrobia bacterium]|nr:MAG: hypothetical protein C5B50_17960 [Verrucomicrobiota bacterium]
MPLGVAWYRPEQWDLLKALAADPESLEHTYSEWHKAVTKTLNKLIQEGFDARKVDVDVLELAAWCEREKVPLDGKARATFAARQLIK